MTEAHVTVVGAGEGDEQELVVRVNGELANFEIKTETLEASFSRLMDDRLSDLIDVACAIFAADSRVSRGTRLRSGFGKTWRRQLSFRFLVRDPNFWNQPAIKTALKDAVAFMSDDILDVDFQQADEKAPLQGWLDLGPYGPRFSADEVILFSGGLDSLSGAYDRLASAPGNVILLSHVSANKRIGTARVLVDRLKLRFPGRILWVPVSAHLKGVKPQETTQRTRSLLFACLGFVTAKLAGARHLRFYENGIVSANLPISAQVIGTMASRTTHPQTLHQLAKLLDAVAPGEIELSNAFAELTKAGVSKRLADLGGADLIRYTVSCSHVRQQSIIHPHCGTCSQCLDRRFGILAAGLSAHDPAEGYEIDVLVDARPKDDDRILALDWARHALRLSELPEAEFVSLFGSELGRLVAGRPDLPSAEHARSILAMHRTHGLGVRDALSAAIKENSEALLGSRLPETSLLRMIVADRSVLPAPISSVLIPLADTEPGLSDATESGRPRARISGSHSSARVVIEGLGEVVGLNASPAVALLPRYASDKDAHLPADLFRYVSGGDLSQELGVAKPTVRQRVKRLREEFADQYEAIQGSRPDSPILIQSRGMRDYRLDPEMDISCDD